MVHITQGYRRDHRPDLNHGMLELLVAPQAGIPLLLQPRSGHRRDAQACGQVIREQLAPLRTTYGTPSLVADRALDRDDTLQKLAATQIQWMTRVPATLSDAQAALGQADAHTMAPLSAGDRDHVLTSTDGGVEPRWGLIASEHRQAQAQRTVDTQLLRPRDQDVKAFTKLGHRTLACEADARQALATLMAGLPATCLPEVAVHPTPRDRTRGRPGHGAQPEQVVDHSAGALASRVAVRQALIAQHRCFRLATNARNEAKRSPPEVRDGDTGQDQAERGVRCLQDPQF